MSVGVIQPVTYGQEASWAKFSVEKYQRMIEAGILDKYDKVELLEGYVVLKMPRDPGHDGTIELLQDIFPSLLPPGWKIRTQLAIVLSDSQPEPDIAVVRGTRRNYVQRHPEPTDIGLLIEVANTSLMRDVEDKARIYARAGIPAYWVINVADGCVEVFTDPSGPTAAPAYADRRTVRPPDAVPLTLDAVPIASVPVADLLP